MGDPVRVSLLVFSDFRREEAFATRSYKQNWTSEIYRVVSISEPSNPWQQPLYTVENSQGNRLRVFRDNLQLLPSFQPRVTAQSQRPRYEGFFYRELQQEQARRARGTYEQLPVEPIVITQEMRRRRRPSVWFGDYYTE